MTREELLSKLHRHSRSEDFRQAKMDKYAVFLFQSCWEKEAKDWATPMLQQQGNRGVSCSMVANTSLQQQQASGKLRRIE